MKSKVKICIGVSASVVVGLLIALGLSNVNEKKTDLSKNGQKIEKPIVSKTDVKDMTEIPSIDTTVLTNEQPYLYLVNPKDNDVYFQYVVTENDKELYESKLFEPNKMVKADVYNQLEGGLHKLDVNILTYDLSTQNPTNTVSMQIEINIKK